VAPVPEPKKVEDKKVEEEKKEQEEEQQQNLTSDETLKNPNETTLVNPEQFEKQ